MGNFRFKKFTVSQENSSMKVGIDSVLLGSWSELKSYKSILDIGTGTGLLSLMMAQRYLDAQITAVEIDDDSFFDACLNFKNSDWSARIHSVLCDARTWNCSDKFDLIISNPPYFSNSLLSKHKSKNRARHQVDFNLNDLVLVWNRFGAINSNLACVLPIKQADEIIAIVTTFQGKLIKYMSIRANSFDKPNRALLMFGKEKEQLTRSSMCIYSSLNVYSKEFVSLTKEFYLNH